MPLPAPAAAVALAVRSGQGFPNRLSGSKSISAAPLTSASATPISQRRRRRCGIATGHSSTRVYCASKILHAQPYPSSTSAATSCAKSLPSFVERHPGTFSQRTTRGPNSATNRNHSQHKLLRVPLPRVPPPAFSCDGEILAGGSAGEEVKPAVKGNSSCPIRDHFLFGVKTDLRKVAEVWHLRPMVRKDCGGKLRDLREENRFPLAFRWRRGVKGQRAPFHAGTNCGISVLHFDFAKMVLFAGLAGAR